MPSSTHNKQSIDTLIHAKWIARVNIDEPLIDHTIVVNKGIIVALLPQNQAKQHYQAENNFQLDHHIVTPGLINSHGHAAMTLFRGYADDLPLMTWLNDYIWPNESRWLSAEFTRVGSELAIAEMIRSGTTCFSDNYFYSLDVGKAAHTAGIRAQLCPTILNMKTPWANSVDDYIAKAEDSHHAFKASPLINSILGPHSPYALSDTELNKVVTKAEQLNCMIQMHVHETAQEISHSLEQYYCRPLARLDRVGMLTNTLQAVHMTQLTEHEIDLIAERDVKVVHCPESNLKLASGFCPVGALRAKGVTLALGTDGAASNNDLDMIGEMRTASMLAKAVAADATELNATESLRMATLEGAKCMGLDDIIGTIEVGKQADLCATALNELANLPVYHPVSQLIYTASRDQVSHVWVAGRILLKNKELLTIDCQKLTHDVQVWHNKLQT
ncbi:N-ethylammeline chlorohydrolase [Marinomonas sp. 42_23_T18]|nr:N-ethylammeline chlorohydrolase [Marinomonas sp. 42_23_T18]